MTNELYLQHLEMIARSRTFKLAEFLMGTIKRSIWVNVTNKMHHGEPERRYVIWVGIKNENSHWSGKVTSPI